MTRVSPTKVTVFPKRRVERGRRRKSVLTLFGTRPEVIKLAPVIHQLELRPDSIRTINVTSGQHSDLLYPFIEMFGIRLDNDLRLMTVDQDPGVLCARIIGEVHAIVDGENPDLILVQGDTTTALAGALVGRRRGVPVGHVEAGLRSGNILSPYPEEWNRRFISQLATYHFAATPGNRDTLLSEGIREEAIFVTGNPVVDALQMVLRSRKPFCDKGLLDRIGNRKCIVLTTHRRESFGKVLAENLQVLCRFVRDHDDVVLVFPMHPNPNVSGLAKKICTGNPRIITTAPLQYRDFIHVLSRSWLIVSDSGGIQEEVPSLGKPLLILRENTERAECIEAGLARLVGGNPETLMAMLEEAYQEGSWINSVHKVPNPFGNGDSAERIVECVANLLQTQGTTTTVTEPVITGTVKTGVTIVVPCFNEEPVLPYLRNRLRSVRESLERKYEVHLILVDDGSTDSTWRLMLELFRNEPNCKLLQHTKNLGVAAAILTGIRSAETEIVCSIDCDCTYDPHELGKLVPMLTSGVDLVTGSPYHPLGRVQDVRRWRLALSKAASFLYRRVLRHKLYTYTSCFRVYRRSAILGLDLRENGFTGIAELIGKLDLQGSTIVECPTSLKARAQGASKMKIVRVLGGHFFLLGQLLGVRGKELFKNRVTESEPIKSEGSREATTNWAQY
jgi:UDP-N-acetylglucosamine 2-epimerase (non-hydrolysing)